MSGKEKPTLEPPTISLVVATRNASSTLDACLQSFYTQNYPNKQLVLVDAVSTDNTVDIAGEWATPVDVIISEPDSGIYDAWNKAIPLCAGEWISFLGADDMLPDGDVYSRIAGYLLGVAPETEIVYGNVSLTNSDGEELLTFGQPWEKVFKRHKAGGTLPHPGSMHRKTLFDRVGLFDTRFRIAGDYELQLRALSGREPLYMPNVTTALHRLGGVSGDENELAAIKEVVQARSQNGQKLPSVKLMVNFTYTLVRTMLVGLVGRGSAYRFLDLLRRLFGKSEYWTKS